MNTSKKCVLCGHSGIELYGYVICDDCKSKLGLFTDKKISEHMAEYTSKERSYEDEIQYRLDFIEKDYIKKRIKLLDILERLKHF